MKKRSLEKLSFLCIILVVLLLPKNTRAQQKERLYVAVLQTKSFVVGRHTLPSGLFSFDQDTSWTHYGWLKNRMTGISYDPSNPNYMFMSSGNGAFRTTDGGQSWRRTTGWQITEVQDVSINPKRPDDVYIATAYGVWRSDNRGANWDSASVGLDSTFVQTIQVDQKEGSYILVGGEGGIYRSTDGAQSWYHVGPKGVPVRDIQQNKSNPSLWIAGTQGHGVFLSHDEGKSWHAVKGKISKKTIYAVATDPHEPNIMAAAGFETGVYISKNGGKKWSQHRKGLPTQNFHALVFAPQNKDQLWAGTYDHGVYKTDDAGKSWQYKGLDTSQVWDMVFIKIPK